MTDISATTLAKTDQVNVDDLQGKTMTIKITKTTVATGDQPVTINFEGDNGKPYKPGKSMRRVLQQVWGSDSKAWIGRSLTLYVDPTVKFGGIEVGGVRISHMSNIKAPVTIALTTTKANKKPFTVKPLVVAQAPVSAPAAVDPEMDGLVAAGNQAASEGVAAYTVWKDSLTAEQKTKIKHLHTNWAATATKIDAENEEPGA